MQQRAEHGAQQRTQVDAPVDPPEERRRHAVADADTVNLRHPVCARLLLVHAFVGIAALQLVSDDGHNVCLDAARRGTHEHEGSVVRQQVWGNRGGVHAGGCVRLRARAEGGEEKAEGHEEARPLDGGDEPCEAVAEVATDQAGGEGPDGEAVGDAVREGQRHAGVAGVGHHHRHEPVEGKPLAELHHKHHPHGKGVRHQRRRGRRRRHHIRKDRSGGGGHGGRGGKGGNLNLLPHSDGAPAAAAATGRGRAAAVGALTVPSLDHFSGCPHVHQTDAACSRVGIAFCFCEGFVGVEVGGGGVLEGVR
eukprot:Rhum_TRINITY_DN12185_c0_g1::Rhum_TRINITY_DN12185_c0_g1_i1::g.49820::m.49820